MNRRCLLGLALVALLAPGRGAGAARPGPDAAAAHPLACDPALASLHTPARHADLSCPVPNLAGTGGALVYEVTRTREGAPEEPVRVVPGRRPGENALRVDLGWLRGDSFAPGRDGFTVMTWVRIVGPGHRHDNPGRDHGTIFALGTGYWDGCRLTFSCPDRTLSFSIGRPKPSSAVTITTAPIPEGVWQHLAVSWDRRVMRVHVGGLLVASGPFDGPFTPASVPRALRVGYANAGVGSVVLDIAEVAIFTRALASPEILRAAFADAPPSPAVATGIVAARDLLLEGRGAEAAAQLGSLLHGADLAPDLAAVVRLQRVEALRVQGATARAGSELERLLASSSMLAPERVAEAETLCLALLRDGAAVALPAPLLRRVLARPDLDAGERASARLALGQAARVAGDPGAALAEFAALVSQADAPPVARDLARVCIARVESDTGTTVPPAKRAALGDVVHPHFRDEARRIRSGGAAASPEAASTRCAPPEWPVPGFTLHVAPGGDDRASGTADRPLATVQRARDRIREEKRARGGALPAGGIAVVVAGGRHRVAAGFALGREDSGTATAPVVYRAGEGETPIFSAGIRVRGFEPVRDPVILARLPEDARAKVRRADLKACGVDKILPVRLGGYSSGLGFGTRPATEVFFNGRALQPARWPNSGFVHVQDVAGATLREWRNRRGSVEGVIVCGEDRLARWMGAPDAILYGYWWYDWADSYERVARVDPARKRIELAPPYHKYGYRAGQRYYALNLLCEIDRPGEYYIDRDNGLLYLLPPGDLERAEVELTVADHPFLVLEGASDVGFRGLTWEFGSADAVHVTGGERVTFAGCAVRHFAGTGVVIRGGTGHLVLACDIHSMGRGGVVLEGGDRRTLAPSGHAVVNCHIHDLSRLDRTYTPAVVASGVGHRIAHNLVHDVASSAFRVNGNDHVVERNEIFRVVTESDDQGGTDMFGDPTFRGNVLRENYWHHINDADADAARQPPWTRAGIRLDDAISGTVVARNVFYRCSPRAAGFGAVQIHGGKENLVDGNLFVECAAAVSFSPWPAQRWLEHVAQFDGAGAIDPRLYRERYHGFAELLERPNINFITRNVALRCGEFLRRDRAGNIALANLITDVDPGFAAAARGDFRLGAAGALSRAGVDLRIPFEGIGLYRDALRPALPAELVNAARRGAPRSP